MAFLGRWEGEYELTVYADELASGLPTVCKGLTRHVTNTPIIVGELWTVEKCSAEEQRAVEKVQWELLECYQRTPPQSVFDASTSHAWNFGSPATCGSAAMKAWNRGEWTLGCRRLQFGDDGRPVWSFVKDGVDASGRQKYKLVRGLANRRAAERDVCEGS
jgi:GH24 family phage-related lysozyme (muramidase)